MGCDSGGTKRMEISVATGKKGQGYSCDAIKTGYFLSFYCVKNHLQPFDITEAAD